MRLLLSSVLLSLAWFGIVSLISSAAAWVMAHAIERSGRSFGAGTLLAVRLFPSASALLFVFTVFLPAHWRFEPSQTDEAFGVLLGTPAIVAAALILRSGWRAANAVWLGYRFASLTDRASRRLASGTFQIDALPGLALAGIVRPRILVGSETLAALTPAELDIAICHEAAHRWSHDNLKRFLMFCAPDLFGGSAAARRLERAWQAAAECQADDRAVRGDDRRAVVLASALVKVAQVCRHHQLMPGPVSSPAWSAFHVPSLLETRVRRLVGGRVVAPTDRRQLRVIVTVLAAGIPAGLWALGLSSELHELTEVMVKFLP